MDDKTVLMSAKPLETGFQLTWYTVKQVLGQGGFGITYLAFDNNLEREVAIKEYLPAEFAHRNHDHSVLPLSSEHGANYSWGLTNFLQEARTLAKFNHNNIVRVHTVFEGNNTAYMVMEYEHGEDLSSHIKRHRTLNQETQNRIFIPIIDGLRKIHDFGFIHRDIKPSNIYIRQDNTPVLIDFGSARQTSLQETGEITSLVSQGYTPLEQYSADYGKQGPWTDIYSLAATMFHGITGKKPDDSINRSARQLRNRPDSLEQLSTNDFPDFDSDFLAAVHAGLALAPESRPQSLLEWQAQLQGQKGNPPYIGDDDTILNSPTPLQGSKLNPPAQPTPTRVEEFQDDWNVPHSQVETKAEVGPNSRMPKVIALCAVLVLALSSIAYFLSQSTTDKGTPDQANLNAPRTDNEVRPNQLQTIADNTPATEISLKNDEELVFNEARSLHTVEAYQNYLQQFPSGRYSILAQAEVSNLNEFQADSPTNQPLREDITDTSTQYSRQEVATGASLSFTAPIIVNGLTDSPGTIESLSKGSPLYSPIDGLDASAWAEAQCSDCHTWTKERLCTQGKFYVDKGDEQMNRIIHPMGGYFKRALKDWAATGCM